MIIQVCPSCGGRLTAHVFDNYVKIKCNACGQELGSFTRADYPLSGIAAMSATAKNADYIRHS